jgi:post-segregation antitoxin (ccd killing protein)
MSSFIKQLVRNKLKQVTPDELLHYAKEYHFDITRQQAEKIAAYLKQQPLDPFQNSDRKRMLEDLAKITDVHTARQANSLMVEIVKEYGLEHLFED